ncbi:MAG TPA: hypothetical protein PLR03_00730, partial [Sphaerochaeta sp.]|nr:hypothetical protein [Sphaerochaeta sp.]
YEKLDQNDEIAIENIRRQIAGETVMLKNRTKSLEIPLRCDVTGEQRKMLIKGGLLNILKEIG